MHPTAGQVAEPVITAIASASTQRYPPANRVLEPAHPGQRRVAGGRPRHSRGLTASVVAMDAAVQMGHQQVFSLVVLE